MIENPRKRAADDEVGQDDKRVKKSSPPPPSEGGIDIDDLPIMNENIEYMAFIMDPFRVIPNVDKTQSCDFSEERGTIIEALGLLKQVNEKRKDALINWLLAFDDLVARFLHYTSMIKTHNGIMPEGEFYGWCDRFCFLLKDAFSAAVKTCNKQNNLRSFTECLNARLQTATDHVDIMAKKLNNINKGSWTTRTGSMLAQGTKYLFTGLYIVHLIWRVGTIFNMSYDEYANLPAKYAALSQESIAIKQIGLVCAIRLFTTYGIGTELLFSTIMNAVTTRTKWTMEAIVKVIYPKSVLGKIAFGLLSIVAYFVLYNLFHSIIIQVAEATAGDYVQYLAGWTQKNLESGMINGTIETLKNQNPSGTVYEFVRGALLWINLDALEKLATETIEPLTLPAVIAPWSLMVRMLNATPRTLLEKRSLVLFANLLAAAKKVMIPYTPDVFSEFTHQDQSELKEALTNCSEGLIRMLL